MTIARAEGQPLDAKPRLLTEMFEATAARHPEWNAIDFLGAKTSWRALKAQVDRVAAGLQGLGLQVGGRVGLCLPNTPHYPILFLAVLKAGGVVVNINPLYVERELRHLMADSGLDIVATCDLPDVHARVSAIASELGVRHVVTCPIAEGLPWRKQIAYRLLRRRDIAPAVVDKRHLPFAKLASWAGLITPVDLVPDALAVLQYTGGTTGHPKAAMLSHANLVAQADAAALHIKSSDQHQARVMGVLPLFHVFALTTVLGVALRIGAEMILLPRFELKQALKSMARTRPTYLPAVPTIFHAIAKVAERQPLDLSTIETCISGGAPLPAEVHEAFTRHTGGRLVEGYGLSEASPIITCNPIDDLGKAGSAGRPFPGTLIEIRDTEAPHALKMLGEPGEICARGPQVMRGYWNRPEDTRQVFCEGALRTGDVGYLDEDGYLFIIDRIKDVILCGGYNVYPRVIEEALYEHPAVAEAVVVGIPHPYRGQCPKAYVTLKPDRLVAEADLLAFLRDKVSKIELPAAVEIRESLPKTLIGKLSKKELVAEELQKAAERQAETVGGAR